MYFPATDYSRSLWNRFAATMAEATTAEDPLKPRAAEGGHLERREGTVTITEFFNTTQTIFVTEQHNFTVFSTIFSTIHITDTKTQTKTQPVTHSKLIVVPSTITAKASPTVGRTPPELAPISTTSAPAKPTPEATHAGHGLSGSQITAIVLGALAAFSLLVLGVFFMVRYFLRKYRAQRVLRKQAQTEGNEMPTLPKYSSGPYNSGQLPEAKRDSDGYWR